MFRLGFSYKNNRRTNFLLGDIFENAQQKLLRAFFGFGRKTLKLIFFYMFRLGFSYKNNRRTNFLLGDIFENAQQKLLIVKNAILAVFNAF